VEWLMATFWSDLEKVVTPLDASKRKDNNVMEICFPGLALNFPVFFEDLDVDFLK
jgi:hypothetical protein